MCYSGATGVLPLMTSCEACTTRLPQLCATLVLQLLPHITSALHLRHVLPNWYNSDATYESATSETPACTKEVPKQRSWWHMRWHGIWHELHIWKWDFVFLQNSRVTKYCDRLQEDEESRVAMSDSAAQQTRCGMPPCCVWMELRQQMASSIVAQSMTQGLSRLTPTCAILVTLTRSKIDTLCFWGLLFKHKSVTQ